MSTSIRVLIVEDSQDDADLLLRELQRGGYQVSAQRVDTPESMKQALENEWEIVVGDYSMPHFSGADALKILREKNREVPFIFVSGTLGEEAAIASLKSGAQDYIMKGNLKRLVPAVRRELSEVEQRRHRKMLELKLQQLEKFEAIGRLAGGIAHDFNNVVAVIMGLAQLGLEEAPIESGSRDRFRKIIDQSQRAGKLTAQLLAFARRQVLQPQNLNLNAIIEGMMSFLRAALGDAIDFRIALAPDLRLIAVDLTQTEQVLMNLCLNARDAMPSGGRLLIQTENVELSEEFCAAHSYGTPGSFVQLTISDTGIGMDPAIAERIFEPFFTTKEVGTGTGLGLATVYGIVKQHGGFINVYSERNQGTTFRVYLPVAMGAATIVSRKKQIPVTACGTETILVAEDNEALRELARESLGRYGYTVLLAANGEEGLRLFEQNVDKIHLVIVDMVMPLLSGSELYSRISAMKTDVPVIFTTGHTIDSASLHEQLAKGAAFLAKPYAPDVLRTTIRTVLDSRPRRR